MEDYRMRLAYSSDMSRPDRGDRHGAVARARIKDVVRDARNGKASDWKKYYKGKWKEPGLGGRSSNIGNAGGHATLMYNSHLDEWITFGKRGRKLYMFRTPDPLDFNVPGQVVYEFPDDRHAYYYTIMPGQENLSVCGKEFYLYYSNVRVGIEHHLALFKVSLE